MSAALNHAVSSLLSKARGQIYVAYSGGMDSQVLLHLCARLIGDKHKPKPKYGDGHRQLTALHVNHGLSPNASQWQENCAQQCKDLGVSFQAHQVVLEAETGNVEQQARHARYDWFASLMQADDLLLTAHHQNDQAETLLLRLMRGSGSKGLAGIPAQRSLDKHAAAGQVLRPLLGFSRAELSDYAAEHSLSWLEDESNQDLNFDRNYLRHTVLPALAERWPNAVQQLARSAAHSAEDAQLLQDLARKDRADLTVEFELSVLDEAPPLDLTTFKALSRARQRNVLQYVLQPFLSYPLARARMDECLDQLQQHTPDAHTQFTLENVHLRLFQNQLYFIRPVCESKQAREWCIDTPLVLDGLGATLSLVLGDPLPEAEKNSTRALNQKTLKVVWRQGGERIQLSSEPFSRSLKKVLQEKGVPPWLRDDLPMLMLGDEIVWVAVLGMRFTPMMNKAGQSVSFLLRRIK